MTMVLEVQELPESTESKLSSEKGLFLFELLSGFQIEKGNRGLPLGNRFELGTGLSKQATKKTLLAAERPFAPNGDSHALSWNVRVKRSCQIEQSAL